jgi:dGTPase
MPSRNEPEVKEALSYLINLGHPPFGHVIEKTLNGLSDSLGGFEGNAQSFRILSRLAFHSPDYQGLNLTRATLCAVLKYPWLKETNPSNRKKWGSYLSEKDSFDFALQLYPHEFEQSPEAFLMDLADDITYCVHDLEDFYRAGRIPLHLLASTESKEVDYFFDNMFERQENKGNKSITARESELKQLFRELLFVTFPATQPYRGSQSQRIGLRSFTGSLIGRYINSVSLTVQNGRIQPWVENQYRDELFMLKELTWTYVIQEPALATQQFGQQKMIRTLFEAYSNAAMHQAEWRLFPMYYQERLKRADSDEEKLRACIDLIAGMTEVQVQRLYSRISGLSPDSSLNDPLA